MYVPRTVAAAAVVQIDLHAGTSGSDQAYGRGGTPVFTCVFEPLARVTPYLTDENGLGSCFGAA